LVPTGVASGEGDETGSEEGETDGDAMGGGVVSGAGDSEGEAVPGVLVEEDEREGEREAVRRSDGGLTFDASSASRQTEPPMIRKSIGSRTARSLEQGRNTMRKKCFVN
jgi:hypothetical protein